MGLFFVFIITFGMCFHLLDIDDSAYGRIHPLFAHIIGTYRSAMGEYGFIHPYQSLDVLDEHGDYIHSIEIVYCAFFIWLFSVVLLTMIFMNFIIAVIGESYAKVMDFALAYDYK